MQQDYNISSVPMHRIVRLANSSMGTVDCAYSIEGKGPPVLLVHGVGGRRQLWRGVTDRLKSEFQCISFDLRGHGESPRVAPDFELDDLVTDLEALRQRLGIEATHVIGHSMGGMVAPAYARRHPERVLSVGLLSTAAFRTDEDRTRTRTVITAMREKGIHSALEILLQRWFTEDFMRSHPKVVEMRKRQLMEMDQEIYLNTFRIYAETEMSPWLQEIRAPALVMTGEFDAGCNPRINAMMAERLPDARLVILEGLRHSILIEAPDRVALPLAEFLRAKV